MLYPPAELSAEKEQQLCAEIRDWALGNGLVMLSKEGAGAEPAPVTMHPTPFPRSAFTRALQVQQPFNGLYMNIVSQHENWLLEQLAQLAKFDPEFTGRLVQLHHKVVTHGITQHIEAGLFRSDYIVDEPNDQIKQVEFNTVSVSFGGLSTKTSELHNFLNKSNNYGIAFDKGALPISPALQDLAKGLATMSQHYLRTSRHEVSSAPFTAILFVVQPGERNALDQRLLEYELFNSYGLVSYRATLSEIDQVTQLIEADHPLDDNNNNMHSHLRNILQYSATGAEISVVYYRSGYGPGDYPTELEWNARYTLESSHAIKCPSVLTQLSGVKKVQQLLSDQRLVQSLLDEQDRANPATLKAIMNTMVAMHPLDESKEGQRARKLALKEPHKYVLKPQREGGGNNIYKEDIPKFLSSLPESQWGAYILMELIHPKEIQNRIVRGGDVYKGPVISELGVFGTVIWDNKDKVCLSNEVSGWLLRTKLQSSNEGGVAAGFGCIDSVCLV